MPLAYEYLGAVYLRLGRPQAAERVYVEALRRGIESAAIRLDLGRIHERRGAGERAEAEWLRALAIDPARIEALFHLGELYREAGRLADAEARFRTALKVNPDYVYAWNGLGRTLAASRPEAALEAFQRAVELAPREPRGILNLAVQLERMGRSAEARGAYSRCFELAVGESLEAVRLAAEEGLNRLAGR
jgi:tetratricopeptide (TPR) repeat protein